MEGQDAGRPGGALEDPWRTLGGPLETGVPAPIERDTYYSYPGGLGGYPGGLGGLVDGWMGGWEGSHTHELGELGGSIGAGLPSNLDGQGGARPANLLALDSAELT